MYSKNPSALLEKILSAVQTVAAGGNVKSPNGGLADVTRFSDLYVDVTVTAATGPPTSFTVTLQEAADNLAASQSDVTGAAITFTSAASEIVAGKSRRFAFRTRDMKQFAGLRAAVTGGTSVGLAISVHGIVAHDTAEVAALGTVLAASTLA
jgi:hypothetical protein